LRDAKQPPQTAPAGFVRWLPYLFAAGAIYWLVRLAQDAAQAAAPVYRSQLGQTLVKAGVTHDLTQVLIVYFAIILLFEITAAALHGTAYYGLKWQRSWGWIVAVVVAGAWSLIIVGIPILVFLLLRKTREAYGIQ
jgi:hypothetical protein